MVMKCIQQHHLVPLLLLLVVLLLDVIKLLTCFCMLMPIHFYQQKRVKRKWKRKKEISEAELTIIIISDWIFNATALNFIFSLSHFCSFSLLLSCLLIKFTISPHHLILSRPQRLWLEINELNFFLLHYASTESPTTEHELHSFIHSLSQQVVEWLSHFFHY